MRVFVMTPTYNEAANIAEWVERARAALPEATLLVVDDNSPDGTSVIAEAACAAAGNARVLVRSAKDGLGNAYRFAFDVALHSGAEQIVHLDADLSHDPGALPALVAALDDGADMAIGSRYVTGGATEHWPMRRRVLSRWGNRYTAFMLDVPLSDVTAGFRAYTADAVRAIDPATTRADGYAFLTELAVRAADRGLTVAEVPIVFADRRHGASKMNLRIIVESMLLVTRWGLSRKYRRVSGRWRRR